MRRLLVLSLFAITSVSLQAQHDSHTGCGSMVGWVPAEILKRPVALRDGVGKLHDPVTTQSPQAQAFYNQGMAYIHSYVWIEAARSFEQALRHDPKLALAHLGLARTFANMYGEEQAAKQLAKAQEFSANITPREKARIAIFAAQLKGNKEGTQKAHLEYKTAIDDALGRFSDDPELWLIRGNAEEASIMGRGQRGKAASLAFYEAALNREPLHFAANHYLIHSYEGIGNVDQALKHGKIYADAASVVPHAQHMYGHDLRRNGETNHAIERFKRAEELERAYYAVEKIDRIYDWHHAHNLSLLATSYQYQGRAKLTEEILKDALAIPAINGYQEFFKKDYAEFLLNRRRYQEALQEGLQLTKSKFALGRIAGHSMAGSANLALGNTKAAEVNLKAAEKDLADSESREFASPYVDSLRGELYLKTGKQKEAVTILKDVQRRMRAIPGPDAWMQAIYRLEWIARMAREAGAWELAEDAAQQMLEHDPHYGGTQLALAYVAQHKQDKIAASHFAKALKAWEKADDDFREVSELKKMELPAEATASRQEIRSGGLKVILKTPVKPQPQPQD